MFALQGRCRESQKRCQRPFELRLGCQAIGQRFVTVSQNWWGGFRRARLSRDKPLGPASLLEGERVRQRSQSLGRAVQIHRLLCVEPKLRDV